MLDIEYDGVDVEYDVLDVEVLNVLDVGDEDEVLVLYFKGDVLDIVRRPRHRGRRRRCRVRRLFKRSVVNSHGHSVHYLTYIVDTHLSKT